MKSKYFFKGSLMILLGLIIALGGCQSVNFDDDYIAANKGLVSIEVPEVKELILVVIALTNYSDNLSYLTYKEGAYFADVAKHFGKYKNEVIVKRIDAAMAADEFFYVTLQEASYAFEFDQNNVLKRKVNFKGKFLPATNALYSNIDELQAFADKTNFRAFYRAHQKYYDTQIKYFRDTANFPKMVDWCNTNFPDVRHDAFRILFSPLVFGTQSTIGLEHNGFSEPHLHINFPYLNGEINKSNDIRRSPFLFTELNHNYENIEARKSVNSKRIGTIFKDKNKWQDPKNSNYNFYIDPITVFEEYMNWALVSLWYLDNSIDLTETERYINNLGPYMEERRGFSRFAGFNKEFVRLYKARNKGETVASLFPKILDWCEKQ